MGKAINITLIIITAILIGITIAGVFFSLQPFTIKETKIINQENSYRIITEDIHGVHIHYFTNSNVEINPNPRRHFQSSRLVEANSPL